MQSHRVQKLIDLNVFMSIITVLLFFCVCVCVCVYVCVCVCVRGAEREELTTLLVN
jgi:ABC-type lipoprotein release transport system permease subunit